MDVAVEYRATVQCGKPPVCELGVTSNQTEGNHGYRMVGPHHVQLRAEVTKQRDRRYGIQVTCTGDNGYTVSQTNVTVISVRGLLGYLFGDY